MMGEKSKTDLSTGWSVVGSDFLQNIMDAADALGDRLKGMGGGVGAGLIYAFTGGGHAPSNPGTDTSTLPGTGTPPITPTNTTVAAFTPSPGLIANAQDAIDPSVLQMMNTSLFSVNNSNLGELSPPAIGRSQTGAGIGVA